MLGLGKSNMFCRGFSRIMLPHAGASHRPEIQAGGWAPGGQRGLSPWPPLEPLAMGMSTLLPVLREIVGAASALQLALSFLCCVPLLAGEGATPRCCKISFCHSAGSNHVTCAHQYPTGKASVADLYWAPARQEALAHHLLLLRMLQALGNPLSCSGTEQAEPNPTSELGAASSPHCRQDESAYLGMGSPS